MSHRSTHGGGHRAPLPAAVRKSIEGLSERDNADLRAEWLKAWGADPPKAARKRFLMLGIAWRWQVEALGGLSPELSRRLSALASAEPSSDEIDPSRIAAAARPTPGTRMIRDWQGARHEVHVTEDGYLWRGKTYGSLSGVAKAITGANRNGPAFFGLRPRERSQP